MYILFHHYLLKNVGLESSSDQSPIFFREGDGVDIVRELVDFLENFFNDSHIANTHKRTIFELLENQMPYLVSGVFSLCSLFSLFYCSFQEYPIFWSSHRKSSLKKAFLKISQNSQEKTSARVSFLIHLQSSGL